MARAGRSAGSTRRSGRLQDLDLNTMRPSRSRKPSSLSLTQHALPPPALPLELVKEILEVLYDAGGYAGTLAACCAASRAFANVARPILWRTVVVDCRNAVNPYMENYESQAHLPWFSAESWDLAERTRRQLRLLADNVELGALVRHFTMADPNGVDRVNSAQLWPYDIALLQDALLRLQAVETVRIGAVFSRDGYAEIAHATIDTGLDATERTLDPPDAGSAAQSLITSPHNPPPTLPLELVEDIFELCWDDGEEGRMAVVRSCAVSRAFAARARPLIWRKVVIQCENVVKAYKPPKWILPEPQYLSASHWNISSSGRKRLRILADRPDLSSLVQDFVMRPPNGIERSESAVIWSDDMGLIHFALDGMHNLVRLLAPSIVDLDKYPITLPDRPHLHLQSLAVYSIARLERVSYHQDLTFFERCPNLVHLDFSMMNWYRNPLPALPPLEHLTYRSKMNFSTMNMLQLLTHFSSTLRRLDLDGFPAAPNCGGRLLPDLGSLSRLEAIHVTLRHHHTSTNEYILPAEFVGPDFARERDDTRNGRALVTMLRWFNTLPRAKQLTLVFVLPPLAHPAMRKANKRFWQEFFRELRDSGWWDMRVPKTVKKVDWSAIFDEDEE